MRALEKKGYSEKEILNTKQDNTKLEDLDYLKKSVPPGPFTKVDEVQKYIDDKSIPEDVKNK